jgi:hypothetical protein
MSGRDHKTIATQVNLTRPEIEGDDRFLSGPLHSITIKDGKQVINFIRQKSETQSRFFYTYTYDPIQKPNHIIEFKMVEYQHFKLYMDLTAMDEYLKNKAKEEADKKTTNKYLKYKHKYLMLKQLLK